MSDMGDMFRDWNAHKKEVKARKLSDFEATWVDIFEEIEGFVQRTPYHYQFMLNGKTVNYWPSTGKWRWDGDAEPTTHHGQPKDLLGYIKNRKTTGVIEQTQAKLYTTARDAVNQYAASLTKLPWEE
jgi:hypothetical protein